MQDLKEIHTRIQQKKKEKKEVTTVCKDVLDGSKPYQDVLAELKTLKEKKLRLEHELHQGCQSELETAERLALDIKTDAQILSDLALTKFMKGETVELTDDNDVKYEPVFKVTFKKTA